MKTTKAIVLVMAALALSATPALAQRGGGSRSGGGGHSSSVSSSRSSGSSHSSMSSSRSSSSSSSRNSSYSSSSRSSSSTPSRSYNTPSRSSSSTPSRSGSYNTPSRSSSSAPSRSAGTVSRGETRGAGAPTVRGGESTPGSHSGVRGREAGRTEPGTRAEGTHRGTTTRESGRGGAPYTAPAGTTAASGRPISSPSVQNNFEGHGYARPGRPGGYMPPAARPIHPAPYFYHPWHHHMVHCHPVFWDPFPPRPWYWPGFWLYCNSYWYDYHVTDVAVVRRYVQDTYHVDMITYGISGDIMYAIVRDGGSTYLQVYDKNDHLLAEQKINKKYCNMLIDSENGGCWISKKHDKDPLLFIWADGQLLIYEAD